MFKIKHSVYLLVLPLIFFASCQDDPINPIEDITEDVVEYDPTPYFLNTEGLPPALIPNDNALTEQGVLLGKMLFYDPIMSKGEAQSCASCHVQTDGFSDVNQFSIGVDGLEGGRQAMSIFNLVYHPNGFFWDGRATTLREQSLMPIQDPLEMDETLENVVSKLEAEQDYKDQFMRAFGSEEITSAKVGLALEQFMHSIISNGSKFDQFQRGEITLTDSEERGRALFFAPFNPNDPANSGADCARCHGGPNFTNNAFMNNGLDMGMNFTDLGRFDVTGNPADRARFKVTSLRNIAVTQPYMHDGRLETLEEVVEHYNSGVFGSPTLDPILNNIRQNGGLGLSQQDKDDLVAFMHTLTDDVFLNNEAYKSPF